MTFFQKSQDTVSSFIYNKNQVQLDKLLWCHNSTVNPFLNKLITT